MKRCLSQKPSSGLALGFFGAAAASFLAGCAHEHTVAVAANSPQAELDRQIVGRVMLDSQFEQNLRALAMPGGRLSGTPNAEKAIEYVMARCRSYGLKNVQRHAFDMDCWETRTQRVALQTEPPRELVGVALGRTMDTPAGGATAEVVDVGKGTSEEFGAVGERLAGKFALVQDEGGTRWTKMLETRKHGGIGMIVMCRPDHEPIIGNCHKTPRSEPAVAIKYDADLLEAAQKGGAQVNIQLDTENWKCRPSNVIAEIPGSGPLAHEQVIITAHLDSWHLAEGALDNGSGSTAILEVARALAATDWRPKRTVRFIWFMGEELGLIGSEAYVRDHADEMDRVVAVINLDMPGRPTQLGHFMHPEIEPFLKSTLADLEAYDLKPEVANWHWSRSDHAPFVKAGVCAIGVGGDIGPGGACYHTTCDTIDTVDVRGTIPTSAIVSILVRRLADEPQRPTVRSDPASVTLD